MTIGHSGLSREVLWVLCGEQGWQDEVPFWDGNWSGIGPDLVLFLARLGQARACAAPVRCGRVGGEGKGWQSCDDGARRVVRRGLVGLVWREEGRSSRWHAGGGATPRPLPDDGARRVVRRGLVGLVWRAREAG